MHLTRWRIGCSSSSLRRSTSGIASTQSGSPSSARRSIGRSRISARAIAVTAEPSMSMPNELATTPPRRQHPNSDRTVASVAARTDGAYTEHRLANGLEVILHEDHSTPMVTINVLYHVGSKNEQRGGTGFAHLFEHLMFDGSRNVQRGGYDHYCTSVGGDNNAFTNLDITDYYISLPSEQLGL